MARPGDPSASGDKEKARDLRNTLLFGGLGTLCLGAMILASGSALQIPARQNTIVMLFGVSITVSGLVALGLGWPARRVAQTALLAYTLVISLAVHFTGGPLTPMPALYLLVVMAASFLVGRSGATFIALTSAMCYAIVLLLEYLQWVSMVPIWQIDFNPNERGFLLVVNWLAVFIPLLIASQLSGALAERLQRTNAQLREVERMRDDLTQMVVHDMRNPLVGLTGWLDLMQSAQQDEISGVQRLMLENARRSGQVLMRMVSELLDISKMEAGRLDLGLTQTDLCALVSESVESMRAVAEIEGIAIRVELDADSIVASCDRQLIGRVLANLLSNAIKHTPADGTITLAVRYDKADSVQVSVSDTGTGIPPEYQQLIFERFTQVKLSGGERRGTGLGLTFCRMAVEAHGGQIWVESQVDQGSTFAFTLPVGT